MSRRQMTIGSRLAVGYAAVLLVSGALLLGGAYLIVARASARYDRAVAEQVEREIAEWREALFPPAAVPALAGSRAGRALGSPPRGLAAPGERSAERRATVAAQRAALPAYRREIALSFAALLALVTVASLGVGRALAAGALRPVRDITRAAQAIGEENLDQRIGADGPDDELTELSRTLDAMLERIDVAVQAQRAFAAHASHELRTPLSVIGAEIDACLERQDTSSQAWRRSGEVIRGSVARSEHLIRQLLLLARARTWPAVTHAVDLAEIVEALVDELPAERTVRSRLAPAPAHGDPALIEAAIANLLDNAARYNVTAGAIELSSWTDGRHAYAQVANDGPSLDAADLGRLFEPFVRGQPNGDQRGTGLGLAIVHSIVLAHGGTLDAAPRAPGGLEVTLSIPRSGA